LRLTKWGSGVSLHGSNPEPLMSALGQEQTFRSVRAMSALPPKADITAAQTNVRFVPKADIMHRSNIMSGSWKPACLKQRSRGTSYAAT
jgi:hypothetical protein